LVGEARIDLADIAFEEERLRHRVPFRDAILLAGAGEFEASARTAAIERAEEGVDPLGRGQTQVEIEVEAGGDHRLLIVAVVVEGDDVAPIAEGEKAGKERVLLADHIDP
jgi:hypothetical protein